MLILRCMQDKRGSDTQSTCCIIHRAQRGSYGFLWFQTDCLVTDTSVPLQQQLRQTVNICLIKHIILMHFELFSYRL